jgi:hypothetical protein
MTFDFLDVVRTKWHFFTGPGGVKRIVRPFLRHDAAFPPRRTMW